MENFKSFSPEEGSLKGEGIEEAKEIFTRMMEQGSDPHLENVKVDNLTKDDWEIFKKFLDGALVANDLKRVEKDYRKKLLEEGKDKENFQNDSRMNFFAFIRNLLFIESLRKEIDNLKDK